ncbi:MAG: phosphoesterase, partial [Bacteroidetes bacterium]
MLRKILFIIFFCLGLLAGAQVRTLQAPGLNEYANINPAGHSVLPSGRYVTPAGQTITINRGPYGLALSPDGKTALVLHNGVVTLIPADSLQQAR